jgi:protein TonB
MSYRQPEPVPETKKEPTKRPKIKPKKTIKIPDEQPEPPLPKEIVKIPDEPIAPTLEEEKDIPEPDELEIEPSDEEELLKENKRDAVSNVQAHREATPLYKKNPPPGYPRLARKKGYEGTVVLSVLVDKNGQVDNLWVFTSSGYRLLDNAAVNAVRKWAFEPGMKGNKKVAMWVKVPIRFQLK